MRRFTKIMLVTAGVFAIVGIGLSVSGAAMGATSEGVRIFRTIRYQDWAFWDDDRDDDDWDVEQEITPEEGSDEENRVYQIDSVKDVEIDLSTDALLLEQYDGDHIRVEVENDKGGRVKVANSSGNLEIKGSGRISSRKVTVFYPEKTEFGKMELKVDAGEMEIADELSARELEISIGAGEVKGTEKLTARSARLEVGAGTLELSGLDAEEIEGECGMGTLSLNLAGKEEDYQYKLECGIGEIRIGDDSFGGFSGTKEISNAGAPRNLELECGMGSIKVEFED